MSLQEEMDTLAAQVRASLPPDWQSIIDRTTEDLRRCGLPQRSLKVGDRAPEFALPNTGGRVVKSADLLAKGHLIVNFYRGGW